VSQSRRETGEGRALRTAGDARHGASARRRARARHADAPPAPASDALRAIAAEAGLERVRIVAWRDLEDPEAGGSELHAHRIATAWAAAGLDVELRASAVAGAPEVAVREGYRVVRRSGRYAVFARAGWETWRRPLGPGGGLVEIWNGMPFWSPVWHRGPRVVFLHHVHAEMWSMALPGWMARLGDVTERRLAPPLHRSTRVVTLSPSSRDEIVAMLGLDPARVSVAPPGVDPRFSPGGSPSPVPLVVAVGRLVPVKRFDLLIRALARVKGNCPSLEAVVVGEGYERARLERLRDGLGAGPWLSLPGRLGDDQLVDCYRRAWVVASTSLREGWGMTLTEAGACGVPAVATDIAGHRDAVVHGRTGLLADGVDAFAAALSAVIADRALRARLGGGALQHARGFSWESTARATLEALAEESYWASGRRLRAADLR
jgi:glycosyltransferase involved in cell wall biosynthesis